MGRPKKNQTVSSVYQPKKIYSLDAMEDIVAGDDSLWAAMLRRFSKLHRVYGFEKVEPPLLEDLRLYEQFYKTSPSQMQNLLRVPTPGGESALRGDFLPGVLRAYYQHKVYEKQPLSKWGFSGFTVGLNQAGDLHSSFKFGLEIFGQFNHLTEAQLIGATWEFLTNLGLPECVLEINHIGKEECQLHYQETLRDFLSDKKYQLCDSCNEHLHARVLNVLRCDNLDCQALVAEAPVIVDFLEPESKQHFTSILEALDELGIPYQLNPLYAGPDGHGRTNLAIKAKYKGVMTVLGEGGYHENLMQNLCGKPHCCFGFSGNLSVVRQLLEAAKITAEREVKSDVFLVPLGELAARRALRLFRDLTSEKISVYDTFGNAGVKNQLKTAENFKAPVALIMGQKEAMDEMVILRDVKSGMQEIISYDKIVSEVKKRLGR